MYTKNVNTQPERSCPHFPQGVARYILSNPKIFLSKLALLPKIERLIKERESAQQFPRQLFLNKIVLSASPVLNGDNSGAVEELIYHCKIANRLNDKTAVSTTAFIKDIEYPDGNIIPSPDTSFLKWVGMTGDYSSSISSGGKASFDLLCISKTNPNCVYLNSDNYNSSKKPILEQRGVYILRYNVLSEGFCPLEFRIRLSLTGDIETTTLELENPEKGTFTKI